MSIIEQLRVECRMLTREKFERDAQLIRNVLTVIEHDQRVAERDLTDDEVADAITRCSAMCLMAAENYDRAGQIDRAENSRLDAKYIESFIPKDNV